MVDRARFDVNNIHSLTAVSNADGITPVSLWADPSSHSLVVGASLAKDNIPAVTLTQAVAVQIVDGSGNQITSFGGGTQYTDGGTPPLHPVAPTLVFDNAGTWAHVSAAVPLPVTGSLTVGGTTDNSAFTAGTSTGTPTMGFYHSVIDAVTDGRAAAVGITSKRAMLVTLQTSAGADTGVAASPLQVSLANTAANATAVKVDGSAVTQPVSGTVALSAGAAVIGHVITDSGSTTVVTGTVTISGAVTEATLDAALISQEATTSGVKGLTVFGAVTTAKPTYTTAKSDALSLDVNGLLRVSLADTPANTNKFLVTADAITFASPQHVITDATSVTAATLSAETTKVIGTVNIAASQTIAVTNAGTFVVQATLAAETTKVIGTVRTADGGGNLYTTNSTTYTAKFAQDGNLLGTLGTAFTTAGKVDVKGADGDVFIRQATAGNLNATVVGQATGSAVPANAFYVGTLAQTALPTAATAGNLTGPLADKFGRQVVLPFGFRDIVGTQTTTISASTAETTIGTAVASTFLDVVAVVAINTSATATRIDFRDTTGGSVLYALYVPAGETRGISFTTPVPQTTVNTNLTAQSSASVTDVRILVQFVKNK